LQKRPFQRRLLKRSNAMQLFLDALAAVLILPLIYILCVLMLAL